MKTLVLQNNFTLKDAGVDSKHVSFLETCMSSVRDWANKNNFEYSLTTDLSSIDWPNPFIHEGKNLSYLQLLKYINIDNDNYQRVVVIDTDVLILGNPVLYNSNSFCVAKYTDDFDPKWHWRFNSGVFYLPTNKAKDLKKWMIDQCYADKRYFDVELDLRQYPDLMTDECFLWHWIKSQNIAVDIIHNYTHFGYEPLQSDSFIHFAGKNKTYQLEFFNLVQKFGAKDRRIYRTLENMLLWNPRSKITHITQ